jgi:hypothetical protein
MFAAFWSFDLTVEEIEEVIQFNNGSDFFIRLNEHRIRCAKSLSIQHFDVSRIPTTI